MGEILGIGMSHYPGMVRPAPDKFVLNAINRPDIPAEFKDRKNWPPMMIEQLADDEGHNHILAHRQQFIENCRKQREMLDAFNPDFILVWGDDQYENFKEDIVPSFCVLAYDDMDIQPYKPLHDRLDTNRAVSTVGRQPGEAAPPNSWNEPEDYTVHVKGKREAGKFLARGLIEEKIDVAYAYEPLHYGSLAHAFLNSVLYLDWDRKGFNYPVLPMQVNCYGSRVIVNRGGAYPVGKIHLPEGEVDPPGPSPERCMEVGAAVARVFERSPWRVALIASSSWSHAFLSVNNYFMWPNVDSDMQMYDAMVRGDWDYLRAIPNEDVEIRGLQEVRNWWCLFGAMEALGHKSPDWNDFAASYLQNSSKAFAVWNP